MAVWDVEDAVLLRCCELFIAARGEEKTSVESVAKALSAETPHDFKRVDVYKMIALAQERGFFSVVPNPARELEERIAETFDLHGSLRDGIHVVPALQPSATEAVSSFAADHALKVIKEVGRKKRGKRVGIGFVGGRTTRRVARLLATKMRFDPNLPSKLLFVSLCSGLDPHSPETAPPTFLGYFDDLPTDVTFGAFVAAAVVSREDFAKIHTDPLYVKSEYLREEVDVVITSLSSFDDRHNVLQDLARLTDDKSVLQAGGVVGDVAYQPYDNDGPADVDLNRRVLSLFDIEQLTHLARGPDTEVLVVGGPCPAPGCHRSREKSLEPLLRAPDLRVWSHVYLDSRTAKKLRRRKK